MCTFLGRRITQKWCELSTRDFSSSCAALSYVTTEIDASGIATITMGKGPVNSLSLEMVEEMKQSFTTTLDNKCRGIILTSGLKTVFCGGLDIMELYQPQKERIEKFWSAFQDLGLLVYGASLPVIAVINGHSPAGGCYLSIATDYRIMLPNYTIGLNETKLGIVAPFWLRETMSRTMGNRQAEMALELGTLFSSEEALKLGLIDQIEKDKDSALQEARKKLDEFSKIPARAFQATKYEMRRPILDGLRKRREEDLNSFVGICMKPEVQKNIEEYLDALKTRKINKTQQPSS